MPTYSYNPAPPPMTEEELAYYENAQASMQTTEAPPAVVDEAAMYGATPIGAPAAAPVPAPVPTEYQNPSLQQAAAPAPAPVPVASPEQMQYQSHPTPPAGPVHTYLPPGAAESPSNYKLNPETRSAWGSPSSDPSVVNGGGGQGWGAPLTSSENSTPPPVPQSSQAPAVGRGSIRPLPYSQPLGGALGGGGALPTSKPPLVPPSTPAPPPGTASASYPGGFDAAGQRSLDATYGQGGMNSLLDGLQTSLQGVFRAPDSGAPGTPGLLGTGRVRVPEITEGPLSKPPDLPNINLPNIPSPNLDFALPLMRQAAMGAMGDGRRLTFDENGRLVNTSTGQPLMKDTDLATTGAQGAISTLLGESADPYANQGAAQLGRDPGSSSESTSQWRSIFNRFTPLFDPDEEYNKAPNTWWTGTAVPFLADLNENILNTENVKKYSVKETGQNVETALQNFAESPPVQNLKEGVRGSLQGITDHLNPAANIPQGVKDFMNFPLPTFGLESPAKDSTFYARALDAGSGLGNVLSGNKEALQGEAEKFAALGWDAIQKLPDSELKTLASQQYLTRAGQTLGSSVQGMNPPTLPQLGSITLPSLNFNTNGTPEAGAPWDGLDISSLWNGAKTGGPALLDQAKGAIQGASLPDPNQLLAGAQEFIQNPPSLPNLPNNTQQIRDQFAPLAERIPSIPGTTEDIRNMFASRIPPEVANAVQPYIDRASDLAAPALPVLNRAGDLAAPYIEQAANTFEPVVSGVQERVGTIESPVEMPRELELLLNGAGAAILGGDNPISNQLRDWGVTAPGSPSVVPPGPIAQQMRRWGGGERDIAMEDILLARGGGSNLREVSEGAGVNNTSTGTNDRGSTQSRRFLQQVEGMRNDGRIGDDGRIQGAALQKLKDDKFVDENGNWTELAEKEGAVHPRSAGLPATFREMNIDYDPKGKKSTTEDTDISGNTPISSTPAEIAAAAPATTEYVDYGNSGSDYVPRSTGSGRRNYGYSNRGGSGGGGWNSGYAGSTGGRNGGGYSGASDGFEAEDMESYLKDFDGDGTISDKDRKQAEKLAKAARLRNKGKKLKGAKTNTSNVPMRPPSKIATHTRQQIDLGMTKYPRRSARTEK